MSIVFPGESAAYRAARDRLLGLEIELRRSMEAVAAARRALPPGGLIPEDYLFQGRGADGTPAEVRLSELFAPGKDSLVICRHSVPSKIRGSVEESAACDPVGPAVIVSIAFSIQGSSAKCARASSRVPHRRRAGLPPL